MKQKDLKQIKEEFREANLDFKAGIQEVNNNFQKKQRHQKEVYAKRMEKNQADWDKMSEKKVKLFNIFMRSVGVLCLLVGFICVFVDPLAIIVLIAGFFFVRFDANKKKTSYKEKIKREKEATKKHIS